MYHLFFFNDTATTEIYTLSLHDALPISVRALRARSDPISRGPCAGCGRSPRAERVPGPCARYSPPASAARRSEEHTSELQSRQYIVCRLLLEKKKTKKTCTNIRH